MACKKIDSTGTVSGIFSRSLWLVFAAFVCISLGSTLYAGYLFIKTTAEDSTKALAGDLTSRLEATYNLLEGMSKQPLIQDTAVSVLDRAMSMKPYAEAFKFWMIGVVDPDGTISSTLRPKVAKLKRDYIPRIMRTGKRELSDPFPAGATGDMNFTQFMPVKKDGKVVSICFVTTPLAHMSQLPPFRTRSEYGYSLLVDSRRAIIAHPDADKLMVDIKNLVDKETFLLGSSREQFLDDIEKQRSGSFICFFEGRLTFTVFSHVADSKWTLIHRVPMLPTMRPILWSFGVQTLLYALFFLLFQRYGRKAFSPVDNIFQHVADLDKSVRGSNEFSVEKVSGLIEISRRGLFDTLTNLPTRHLFYQKVGEVLKKSPGQRHAVFFFDMDRLKPINDNLGHDAGDMALREFADKLREFADKRNALACRYGGDEFVLFAPVRDDADIEALACELSKTQRGSVEGNGKEYVYSTSIGICPYPLEGFLSFEEALQAADQALYKAKQQGRATFAVYEPDENARRG